MKAPKRPIQAVSTWVRRQPPKVKAFLAVVSGMAALVLLRAIVHDHDNLFVAAEAVHSIGIAVLIYKLMKEKTCAGMDLSILSLMLWSVFVFNLVWGKFGSLRTWNLEKMKFWALGTGHFSVEELGRKKKERKKLVFIFLKMWKFIVFLFLWNLLSCRLIVYYVALFNIFVFPVPEVFEDGESLGLLLELWWEVGCWILFQSWDCGIIRKGLFQQICFIDFLSFLTFIYFWYLKMGFLCYLLGSLAKRLF